MAKRLLRDVPHPILDGDGVRPSDAQALDIYDSVVAGTLLKNDEVYVRGRLRDLIRERGVLEKVVGIDRLKTMKILDVAGGNGAFELALAAAGYFAVSVESLWNPTIVEMRRRGANVRRVIANAEQLPFKSGVFDVVSLHDAVEHFRRPRAVASSITRVAKSGARIFVTTVARLKYLLKRDPHYRIPLLVALPDKLQHRVVKASGFDDLYHTERIYWSAREIAQLFDGVTLELVLSRWKILRNLLFDEIVLRKSVL